MVTAYKKIKIVIASSYRLPDLPRARSRDDGGVANWRTKKPIWVLWVICMNKFYQCGKKYSSVRCRMRRVNMIITQGVVHQRWLAVTSVVAIGLQEFADGELVGSGEVSDAMWRVLATLRWDARE